MQSFFFGKGHDPVRCEKLRKETSKLRSQILQYDSTASFDDSGVNGDGGGGKNGGWATAQQTPIAKKIGNYCIACELARLFQDMFSTEGGSRVFSRYWRGGVGWRGMAFVLSYETLRAFWGGHPVVSAPLGDHPHPSHPT